MKKVIKASNEYDKNSRILTDEQIYKLKQLYKQSERSLEHSSARREDVYRAEALMLERVFDILNIEY